MKRFAFIWLLFFVHSAPAHLFPTDDYPVYYVEIEDRECGGCKEGEICLQMIDTHGIVAHTYENCWKKSNFLVNCGGNERIHCRAGFACQCECKDGYKYDKNGFCEKVTKKMN